MKDENDLYPGDNPNTINGWMEYIMECYSTLKKREGKEILTQACHKKTTAIWFHSYEESKRGKIHRNKKKNSGY